MPASFDGPTFTGVALTLDWVERAVARITLTRPAQMNTLSHEFLAECRAFETIQRTKAPCLTRDGVVPFGFRARGASGQDCRSAEDSRCTKEELPAGGKGHSFIRSSRHRNYGCRRGWVCPDGISA